MKKLLLATVMVGSLTLASQAADKKIILLAGNPSHGPAQHEHRAGILLFEKCLQGFPGITTQVYTNGGPDDWSVFAGAAAVVIYSDGGGGHPALQKNHLAELDALMKKGCGFVTVHYAVEPTIEKGQKEFLEWMGGAFEVNWSVNPHWEANFIKLPKHPITRGVHPFKTTDEWYFHMRFANGMKGVTPILTAIPPDSTMDRPDGTHSGNPAVREAVKNKEPQHVSWAYDRPDGGRGFGFCGGHFHNGWGNEDQRKLVLNAILWVAHVDVPKNGVESKITEEDLQLNLDPKNQPRPKPAKN